MAKREDDDHQQASSERLIDTAGTGAGQTAVVHPRTRATRLPPPSGESRRAETASARDYEVGYRRPPRANQFQPGQSGNPRGRPRGVRSVEAMLADALYQKVVVTKGGRRRQITALDAFLHRVVSGAVAGDARQGDKLLKLLPLLHGAQARDDEAADTARDVQSQADARNVLVELARMMGAESDELFLGAHSMGGGQHDDDA